MPIRHSKNIRAVLSLNKTVHAAILAESEATGFSPSDIINREMYAVGYGKATVDKTPAKPEPTVDLPPGYPWQGDPNDDLLNYAAPKHRIARYRQMKFTAEKILEAEKYVSQKWPNAELVTLSDMEG